ncbi:MAG: hypothetical protein LYZ69_01380 [Nitrososphaerales archaeon]|nr:hypothetical protein [Nitrososphaerales archaeon]
MKRRGQASIIGSILFFVLFASAMAGVAYYASSQSQANGAANRAQTLMAQKGSEQLTYGALSNGSLTIQNTGGESVSVVEVIIKYSNGTVYTASPSTSSMASNNLLQVGKLIPSSLQSRYNSILSSTNPADEIGIVTSRGNTLWLKPAVAAQTNPNLNYDVTFSANGASAFGTSPVLTVDGVSYTYPQLPVTLSWFAGTKHTYAFQSLPQGSGTRVGATATGLTTATSGTLTATSAGTVQASYTTQYLLTVSGGSGVMVSPASPTNDGYYPSGTSVQVALPNAWNLVSGQSRQNLLSYSLDGASPTSVTRSGSGNFVYSLTMGAPHVLSVDSVAQYYLSTTGGNGLGVSAASPTNDGFYDSGTQLTVSSNWVWSVVSDQSRSALSNWQLDGADQNPIRSSSGTFTSSTITMSTYHTVALDSVTQYFLALSGGGSYSYSVASPTGDSWFDSGTVSQVQSAYAFNVVAGQTRSNLLSYAIDGAQTTLARAGSGSAGPTITFSTFHTLSFTSTSQYALNAVGGDGVTYSGSVTGDGWYDSGSTATVTTNYVWGVVTGQSRLNLASWNLDGGANQAVTRVGTGTFTTTSVTMNTFHTINFNPVTQYYVTTETSVPSSGSTGALSVSYSYQSPSTVSWTGNGNGFQLCNCFGGTATQGLIPEPPASYTVTGFSWSISVTQSGTLGDSLSFYISFNGCYTSWYSATTGSSGSYSGSCLPESGASIVLQWSTSPGCWSSRAQDYFPCGTYFTITSSGTWTYTLSSSGSTSSGSNTYSVSGNTVTYSYGVGYNFPGGSSSTSWSASWPSAESYSSNSCASGSVSGNTVSGTGGTCTLTTTQTGSSSVTFASPTGDSWYDSGAVVGLTSSALGAFAFSSWSASSGNIMITSTSSASTTATVDTYGTITASFNVVQ